MMLAQEKLIREYEQLLKEWNLKLNLVSRNAVNELYPKHLKPCVLMHKVIELPEGVRVLDMGTGGGIPGIPLALLNPKTEFLLVDSIAKKIAAVQDMIKRLNLSNARAQVSRIEQLKGKYHMVVGRGVSSEPEKLKAWLKGRFIMGKSGGRGHGLYYLTGEDSIEKWQALGVEANQVWRLEEQDVAFEGSGKVVVFIEASVFK